MMIKQPLQAVVVSIGEELLQGRVLDRNARFISGELLKLGIRVLRGHTIGDQPGALSELLQHLRGNYDLVITSGGLGPTVDDRVRLECANTCGVSMVAVEYGSEPPTAAVDNLAKLWRRQHQSDPPPAFLAQGMIPAGAQALHNRAGTAWGFSCDLGAGTRLICLPGPPVECQTTFLDGGGIKICGSATDDTAFGVFHTAGWPESKIEMKIRDLMLGKNPQLGINASARQVSISVLARSRPGEVTAVQLLDQTALELRTRLGDILWGRDEQSLERVVVSELMRQQLSVATAESCTGGLVAAALTSVPGASQVFGHGWTTYADQAKQSELGVDAELLQTEGAVSSSCAIAMAEGARERAGSDWAVSSTGIAGPGGGSDDKPVGLVFIGVAGPHGAFAVRRRQYARSGRKAIQQQTVRDCLDVLRRELMGLPPLPERK